jgi:hypothetical protein
MNPYLNKKAIVSKRGQWDYPGQDTIVPTSDGSITMQGVNYPVYGQDETGYGQMMYPNKEYQFPGKMVYEKPMMAVGGIARTNPVDPVDPIEAEKRTQMLQMYNEELQKAKNKVSSDAFKNKFAYEGKMSGWNESEIEQERNNRIANYENIDFQYDNFNDLFTEKPSVRGLIEPDFKYSEMGKIIDPNDPSKGYALSIEKQNKIKAGINPSLLQFPNIARSTMQHEFSGHVGDVASPNDKSPLEYYGDNKGTPFYAPVWNHTPFALQTIKENTVPHPYYSMPTEVKAGKRQVENLLENAPIDKVNFNKAWKYGDDVSLDHFKYIINPQQYSDNPNDFKNEESDMMLKSIYGEDRVKKGRDFSEDEINEGYNKFKNLMILAQNQKSMSNNNKNPYAITAKNGAMIKRADGSYSERGLWDNIRANKGSGKKPTEQMLEQEKKIKKQEMGNGGKTNPYFKKFRPGGKPEGDPEDPDFLSPFLSGLASNVQKGLNYGLSQGANALNALGTAGETLKKYQQVPTQQPNTGGYSWGPSEPTQVVNTTGSGHSQTMPSVNTFQGNYDPRMPGEKALQAADKAVGQYLVQPTIELFNTPFALYAEGVDALEGQPYDFSRALPNPTRMAFNAEGIDHMIPQQQFLADYLDVDREKNPYLAMGLDAFTPGPAMFTKPISALTGIGKAATNTIKYAPKINALDRAIDNPMRFFNNASKSLTKNQLPEQYQNASTNSILDILNFRPRIPTESVLPINSQVTPPVTPPFTRRTLQEISEFQNYSADLFNRGIIDNSIYDQLEANAILNVVPQGVNVDDFTSFVQRGKLYAPSNNPNAGNIANEKYLDNVSMLLQEMENRLPLLRPGSSYTQSEIADQLSNVQSYFQNRPSLLSVNDFNNTTVGANSSNQYAGQFQNYIQGLQNVPNNLSNQLAPPPTTINIPSSLTGQNFNSQIINSINPQTLRGLTTTTLQGKINNALSSIGNVVTNINQSLGKKFFPKKTDWTFTDSEKRINEMLKEGLGIKKTNDEIYVKATGRQGYAGGYYDIFIKEADGSYSKMGDISFSEISPGKQSKQKTFTEGIADIFKGKKEEEQVGPILKKGTDFPYSNKPLLEKADTALGAEVVQAVKKTLKEQGGKMQSSNNHFPPGRIRYIHDFKKGRVDLIEATPEKKALIDKTLNAVEGKTKQDWIDYFFENEHDFEWGKPRAGKEDEWSALQGIRWEYKKFGGIVNPYLQARSGTYVKSSNKKVNCDCGWSWDISDGGSDPYKCHKCGNDNSYAKGQDGLEANLPKASTNMFSDYNPVSDDYTAAMNGMMKARIATDAEFGNAAAKRLTSPFVKPYMFTGNEKIYGEEVGVPAGATGTHFMSSMGQYAVPFIQQKKDGSLYFNENASPSDLESMKFETESDAEYFSNENYKKVAPLMTNWGKYKKGGESDLVPVEVERSERIYDSKGNLLKEIPADAPTHEEGGVKLHLRPGTLVFPKKYYKALDMVSTLPEFNKIKEKMLDNAEKAYLRGEPYSSGGKRDYTA